MENIFYQNVNILYELIFLVIAGLLTRLILSATGQTWVKTYSHTAGYILLPVIGYVISTVIAGNIALSLGMIGALSIVRFRHPVKNSLELIIFFALLTLGVAASVDINWAILLLLVVLSVLIFIPILNFLLKKINYDLYSVSFSEGISINIIEITSKAEIKGLRDNSACKNYIYSKEDNKFYYRMTFKNKQDLDALQESVKDNADIININSQFVD